MPSIDIHKTVHIAARSVLSQGRSNRGVAAGTKLPNGTVGVFQQGQIERFENRTVLRVRVHGPRPLFVLRRMTRTTFPGRRKVDFEQMTD